MAITAHNGTQLRSFRVIAGTGRLLREGAQDVERVALGDVQLVGGFLGQQDAQRAPGTISHNIHYAYSS
jgi:hypothetical protein